ncbi:MAG: hypothetical protein KatS3mg008_0041 [Acidimicrobiales bacterium]|nr:MAG: hypothetical protein KatS3mg008_0041 [Acidimicrobiales bacterium]
MRIHELTFDGGTLEFHPNMTVVEGLSESARAAVVDAARALAEGRVPRARGVLEAHGVLFDIDESAPSLLGLGTGVDVVVCRDDLEPARADNPLPSGTSASAPSSVEDDEIKTARRALEAATKAYEVLKEAADRAEAELQVAAEARQRVMVALDQARRDRDTARARMQQGPRKGPPSDREYEIKEEIVRVQAQMDEVAETIELLERTDPRPIQVLLDEYRKPPSGKLVPSPEAQALADQIVNLREKLAEVEARFAAEGKDITELADRVDRAREELAAAERAMARPQLTPEDERELEEAHEAVLEAERKLDSFMGRKKALQELEEAKRREQEILDRVGFPTWAAYVMGASLLNVDPVAEQRLERARQEKEEAERAWEELLGELEADPEYSSLLDEMEAAHLAAFDLLGGEPEEGDVVDHLRALMVPDEGEVTKSDLIDALIYQLQLREVDVADDAPEDVVLAAAQEFLDETRDHWDRYAVMKEEQVRLGNRLRELKEELELLGAQVETPEELEAKYRAAEAKVEEILKDLEHATELEAELASQLEARQALAEAAKAKVDAAAERVRELVEGRAAAKGTGNAPGESPYGNLPYADEEGDEDELGSSSDDIEFFFLSRLASLRAAGPSGSFPLVVDRALDGIDDAKRLPVLEKLAEMSESVQVIYLTEDPAIAEWAASRGDPVALVKAPAQLVA